MSFFPPLTRMVKALIIVTSAVFLLTYLPLLLFGWRLPFVWLGLQPREVVHNLYFWQLFTYLFLHGGWFHIIFNMYALWIFGADLEQTWGGPKFLYYFFLTGVGAGAFDVALSTIFPPAIPTLTIGCSGAIYGILVAYALYWPNRMIYLWMIVPVKVKWFAIGMGAIEFLSEISGSGSGISHLAHLGGILVGYLYLRGGKLNSIAQWRWADWRRARLRRKFEVYMRKQEKKSDRDDWVN